MKWRLALVVVWTLVGTGVLVYFFGNVLSVLAIPMGIIVWSVIFVFGLRSPVNWMDAKGLPRGLACAIAYVVMITAVVIVVILATSPVFGIGDQFGSLLGDSSSIATGMQGMANGFYERYPALFQDPTLSSWIDDMIDSFGSWTETLVSSMAQSIISLTAFTVNAIITIAFALVASFWILLELPNLRSELSRLLGENRIEDVDFLHLTFTRTLGGYLKGLVILCGVIAVGCSIGYTMVGLPNGVAFGIISGLCDVIPVIGQWIAAIMVLVTAIFMADFKTALLAALVAIIYQRVIYTVLYPKIMADSVDVHPVLIIVSMMVGYALGSAMGGVLGSLIGMLVSIPLAAVAKALFVYYFEKRTGRHLVAEDGVFFKGVPNVEDVPDPVHNASSPSPSVYAERLRAMNRKEAATEKMKTLDSKESATMKLPVLDSKEAVTERMPALEHAESADDAVAASKINGLSDG